MDYIEQGFEIPGKDIPEHIVTKHRLQAFSPEYFKKNIQLFSYSEENLQAAQCTQKPRKDPVPFVTKGLSDPPEAEWKTVILEDLCRFFGNPSRFLLQRRLRIYLEERGSTLEEREAFELKGLEKYQLEQHLVKNELAGQDLRDALPLARAAGQLPHGTVGECIFEDMKLGVERFSEKILLYMRGLKLVPLDVDMCISGFKLTGRIDALYPERLIKYRYARIKPKDRLEVWIHHLFLNIHMADHYPRTSMLAGLCPQGRDPQWIAYEYLPVENSRVILEDLLKKYWAGLKMPLHFFPRSSWDYAFTLLDKGKPREDALEIARSTWTGNDYALGECEDADYRLCFKNTDPLDSEFQDIAEDVLGPLIDHQKEI
jgi:exodeoxyribonuclease V gamma subunit